MESDPFEDGEITEDSLLSGRVRLLQPKRGYRAGIDPVFLAAAVRAVSGQRVLDLGCGAGAGILCLLRRCPDLVGHGLELQPFYADLAIKNAELNGMTLQVHRGDVGNPPEFLKRADFDHVICNPPYNSDQGNRGPTEESRAIATQEKGTNIDVWISAALQALKRRGHLTLVYRSDRLAELIVALHKKASVKILPLWPKPGAAAKRVIVSARKGGVSPLQLLPGIVLHNEEGGFSSEANAVLRGDGPLPLIP